MHRWLRVALGVVAIGVLAYALAMHVAILRIDAPLEYREPAMLLQTDLLLRGGNPYDLSNQPLYTNIYGIVYQSVVHPLARIGGSTYLVHRLVSAACVVAVCGLTFWVLRRQRVSIPFALAAAALVYADLALRHTPRRSALPLTLLARPDALGLLFMMLGILIPWRMGWSTRSLIASAALTILAFCTKPYFFLGCPIVAIHLFLFAHKGKALAYAAATALAFVAALFLINSVSDCYIANCIVCNLNGAPFFAEHLVKQLRTYLRLEAGLLVIALIAGGTAVWKWKRSGRGIGWNWRDLRRPLLDLPGDVFVTWLVVCAAVLMLRLGGHIGNFLVYFFQLLTPPLTVVVLRWLDRLPVAGRSLLTIVVLHALLVVLIPLPALPRGHREQWAEWENLLAPHQRIYAPPPLAMMVHRQGKPIYDAGLTDSFPHCFPGSISPSDETLRAHWLRFSDELAQGVTNQSFDLILLPYNENMRFPALVPYKELEGRYQRLRTMQLPMDFQDQWEMDLYVPIRQPPTTTTSQP